MTDKTSDTPRTDDISLSQEVVEECRDFGHSVLYCIKMVTR